MTAETVTQTATETVESRIDAANTNGLLDQAIENTVQRTYSKINDPAREAREWGEALKQAGLATTPGGGSVVAMICFTEGISFKEFGQRYYPYNGTLTVRAGYVYSEFLRRGGRVEFIQMDDEACIGKVSYGQFEDFQVSFTLQEAERAGLLKKDNWKCYPGDMLFNRFIMRACRRVAPELVAGVYDPDEVDAGHATPVPHPPIRNASEGAAANDVAGAGAVDVPASSQPPPATSSPAEPLASNETLTRLAELGCQFVKDNGEQFTVADITEGVRSQHGCSPAELTEAKAVELCQRFEAMLAEKKQSAA